MFNSAVLRGCDIASSEWKKGLWVRGVPYAVPDSIIEVMHISGNEYCIYVGKECGICFGNEDNRDFIVQVNDDTIGELFEDIEGAIDLLCDLIHPNNKW